MKKTVLLLVLFLGTLALGMAQSKENDFLDQPYICLLYTSDAADD